MKNTIFYTIKSVLDYWYTFSCCLKAGFSSFLWTNTSIKKLVFYGALLLLGLGFTTNTYGQDVGSSAVKANFGIDGDVYANYFQFQPIPPVTPAISGTNTDDWFVNTTIWSGLGRGVIDQATPPHNPLSDNLPGGTAPALNNTSFERRQSKVAADLGTDPDVYAVYAGFPAVRIGEGIPYLWLDAVYGRDTYVNGGSAETSYFAGSGDKNSDNPNTWNIGTAGSVPQKDDIIDVYAHLRGEGPRIPPNTLDPLDPLYNANDDKPFTNLWVYAGGSVVVTNGNKHLDFEYFRTGAELVNGAIVNTGPDGGRTEWKFNLDGSIAQPGTIIVSVDYINGGNVPSIRIRVWMSQTTYDTYNNGLDLRPFNVDKTVAFEKGTDSGVYGYAAINPIGAGEKMWGRVNDNQSSMGVSATLGPPWGTWEGTAPDAVTSYARYQFVEIGIDLTAFGLDRRGSQNPCSNILGSLLVKTRSSGGGPNESAFGSELKDFAGPYLFGFTVTPPDPTVGPLTACEIGSSGKATFNLTAAVNTPPVGTTDKYFENKVVDIGGVLTDQPDTTKEITGLDIIGFEASIGQTKIWVRRVYTGSFCGTDKIFILTVNPNPTATAGPDQTKCQTAPSGPTSFTMAGTAANGTTAWTQIGSTGTASASITTSGSLTSTVSVSGVGTVTLRLTTTSNATPSCGTATDDVILTVNANPTANAGPDQTKCQTAPSGPTSFTMAGTAANGTAAWTQIGSTGTASASITTPGSLTTAVSVSGIGTVTLRLTTTSNATPSCGTATDDVILTVNANPTANAGPDQAKCQTAPSGPTSFTMAGTAANGTIAWTQIGSTGTASASITTPGSLTTAVSVSGIGTVTLRLTTTSNATPSCGTATDDVVLTVNANATNNAGPDQTKCQTAPSGPTSFTMAGTAANGTSAWTQVGSTGTASASITTPSSLTTTVSVSGIGTVTLRLTTTSECGNPTDDVILTVNANPTANAGPDQTKCQTAPSGPTSFTMAGTAANGTTAWTQIGSTGTASASITTSGSLTTAVSVSGIGTVTLRLTTTSNATPSCGTATDDVILTVNANPTANGGPDQTKCQTAPSGPTSFTMAGTAANGTTAWTQIGSTGTASASITTPGSLTTAVSVSGIGTVTLRLTTTSNATPSCGTATDDVILTVNANPTANAGPDQAKCQTAPSGPTSFTMAGTAANGTTAWTQIGSTGTAGASITTPSSLTSTVSVSGVGTVTLRLTTTSNANPSCGTATDDVVLTVNANPTCNITGEQTVCSGDSSTFTATVGMKSYSWTGPGGFSAITQSINVSVAGIYEVTITNTNDCTSNCSRELFVETCGGAICTYTQGAYGNSGGKYCDGTTGGIPTADLIAQSLTNAGGSITVGKPGHSVIMNLADVSCIINVMPGGGKARELDAGNYNICSLPASYLKNGKINNVLLSQTIALALNVNITSPSELGAFILQAGTLATAKPDGGCGSDNPKDIVCGHYEGDTWIPTMNEYTRRTFSAAVIDAINGDKTVAGLLDLANRALANVDGIKNSEGGATLSDIAGAVGAINEVFDECAIFKGWNIPECSNEEQSSLSSTEIAGFTASPVPFKDQLTIKYNFDYVSKVKIEVFDASGGKVHSQMDSNSYLNKQVVLNLNVKRGQEQVYIVKLTTDRGSSTKKVMSSQ